MTASFFDESKARFKREREERDAQLRAQGFRLLSCLAVRDARDGTRRISTSIGEVEHFLLVNPPRNYLEHGIGCVLVGPDSRLERIGPEDRSPKEGPVLTVFKGAVPA